MFVCQDGATSDSTTPASWTSVDGGHLTGPDGGYYHLYRKTALCDGSETIVIVTMGIGVANSRITILTLSARSSATPTFAAAMTFNTSANNPAGAGFSLSTGGGSAAAGDDLVLFVGFDPTGSAPSAYTLGSVSNSLVARQEAASTWLASSIWSANSIASGPTGSITATVTGGGAVTAGYAAIAIAFPGSAGASTSDDSRSAARRQLEQNAIYRMSPRSQREAQQFLRAQKRAYGFAAAA
jgi:hypothetical protein